MGNQAERMMTVFYEHHAAAVRSYALRLTRDPSSAQDVMQETFLRAWRHPALLEKSPEAALPWLYTVARNIVIDDWRTRRSRTELLTWSPPDARIDHADIEVALQSWLVADAIRHLSANHRDVLVECYYRGCSVAEAAGRLGIPEGTVKSRCHYALRSLRVLLAEVGVSSV